MANPILLAKDTEEIYLLPKMANRHGMIVTGGSDFHSDAGYHDVALGTVHLPDGAIAALDARIARYA